MIQRGREGEEAAVRYLEEHNCRICRRNYRCKYGEIDIIAYDKLENYLLIVEVKNRIDNRNGAPCEAVDFRKQRKICMTFNYYRMEQSLPEDTNIRFDVMECYDAAHIHWIKNAFEYVL